MSLVARRLAFGDELYLAHLPEGAELFETVERLSRVDGVRSVEPDLIEHLPQRRTPADPDFGQQWQHHENGVRSEPAWDRATGKGVRVAVIDNGFDVRHPDLRDGIDAAAAAYFANDPFGEGQFEQSLEGFPPGRHGTFCAGMTVARANDVGGCGVGFDAAFIPVACLTDQVGSQTTLAEAIAYAADPTTRGVSAPGADVISCSLGPNGARWVMRQVLAEAINFVARTGRQGRGAPIFWAATNGDYPISDDDVCSHPDVIAVSRMGPDERHDQAGHGRGLEYLAPGVDVYSTSQGRSYGFQTGCSFAAPCAAGVAVLVLERNPHLSAAECRQLLRRACRRVGGGVSYDAEGWHERYGFGCIDASLAVQPV
jgi:thermitase